MAEALVMEWFAQQLSDRTARGIAVEMTALIRSGAIPVGTQLPAVRELAQVLKVSPATMSAAWGELRRHKVISGMGRNGVWVCGDKISSRPLRFETIGNFGAHIRADLAFAVPDPRLLPDLSEALMHGAKTVHLNSYQRQPITDALRAAVQSRWCYESEAFMAVNGGFDGIRMTLQTLIMSGSAVAIEDPTATRLLDILDDLGAHIIPVACDNEGPLPSALAEAIRQKPVAFIYQPRTHAASGNKVSARRLKEMADILQSNDMFIIEDDGLGDISGHPPVSLGTYYPKRTVHIISYSKSFGPDLRLAVLSSSAEIIDQLQAYRNFAAGWTSRILQDATAWLLNDAASNAVVANARNVYAERRNALTSALRLRGVDTPIQDGLCLWIPVPSEQFALVTMAARGFAVQPGSRFCIKSNPHIRVSTSMLTEQVDAVADAIHLSLNAI